MPTSVIMPKFGLVPEGKVLKWLKKEGDTVEKGEPFLEIESEKVNVQIESPAAGVLSRIIVQEDVTVPAGETLAFITQPGEAVPTEATKEVAPPAPTAVEAPAEAAPVAAAPAGSEERAKTSPLARRLAAELNVDLSTVTGSGPGGRIVKEDILQAAERAKGAAAVVVPTLPAAAEVEV
ncbi:MAG: E3 binding domain-containing protein, partial [Candidatus Bathyarchaeia archaeon]